MKNTGTTMLIISFFKVCAGIRCGKYPFVMCNFAAPDMVGHTGKYEPAVKACTATGIYGIYSIQCCKLTTQHL